MGSYGAGTCSDMVRPNPRDPSFGNSRRRWPHCSVLDMPWLAIPVALPSSWPLRPRVCIGIPPC